MNQDRELTQREQLIQWIAYSESCANNGVDAPSFGEFQQMLLQQGFTFETYQMNINGSGI